MIRKLGVAIALVAIGGLTLFTGPANATVTPNTWHERAIEALDKWNALGGWHSAPATVTPSTSVLSLAYAGIADATLNGWSDPEVTTLLDDVIALRNPDGGWGVNVATDYFADGTVNPATTSYTVTMADHVGPFLLGAYQHGLIGVEPLTTIGSLLVHMPSWSVNGGICLAYSESPNDHVNSGYCVHNVNAAAGLFLTQLAAAGVSIPGATSIRAGIVKTEVVAYNGTALNWPYKQAALTAYEDKDHEALNVEALLTEAPSLGYVPQVNIILNAFPTDTNSRLAHFRLGSTRCSSANQWFGEFDDWLANPPASANVRYAQMARWASRISAVCES